MMEKQKIAYEELKEKMDMYLDKLNILKDVNEDLNKKYLYEEIKDNVDLLEDNFRKKEELKLSENELTIKNNEILFSIKVTDEITSKNIKVISAKKNIYNNRLIYLIKDTALISIDKETGDYSIKDNVREVVEDTEKTYSNCDVHALSKIRNFTKEGLEKNEVIMSSKKTIDNNNEIDFDSFENPLFISTSDHVTIANRMYFDVINYIEIDNKGNELFNGYQELSNHKGYRKFSVNNDILGIESIHKINKEEIEEKLLKETDAKIRKLLIEEYSKDRDIFSYSKTEELQKERKR